MTTPRASHFSHAKYATGQYDEFNTSDAILWAIEQLTGQNLLEDTQDVGNEAQALWTEDLDNEVAAWLMRHMHGQAGDQLCWGELRTLVHDGSQWCQHEVTTL